MTQERLRAHLSMSCTALWSTFAVACDERTSATGTSPPLPACNQCSLVPRPLTRTLGLRGPQALGGTQSQMKNKSAVLRLQMCGMSLSGHF
eukprot:301050-Amphidinium_carterae.1